MKLDIFQVDAFTNSKFKGNPAAVVILKDPLDTKMMQQIAMENNLSETAFVDVSSKPYLIRWFTPTVEVDLCGHATLASARVIFEYFEEQNSQKLEFICHDHGKLVATKEQDIIYLDFPADEPKLIEDITPLSKILDIAIKEAYTGLTKHMVIVDDENAIKTFIPDFNKISELDSMGLIVTSTSKNCDFVSRCFFPKSGVDEDPVTGSAHTLMTPFWAQRLNKQHLIARQISNRGGEIQCELLGNRVILGGHSFIYLKGKVFL